MMNLHRYSLFTRDANILRKGKSRIRQSLGKKVENNKFQYLYDKTNIFFHNNIIHRPRTVSFTLVDKNQRARFFSSHRARSKFKLDALPFSVTPDQALQKFESWAKEEQGLEYLIKWSSVRIAASYVPVWSFDMNVRFQLRNSYRWKPAIFEEAYPKQSTIFLSGISAYSGHSYRRTLINPIHNTTLVFLNDKLQPFSDWMMRDIKLSNGERLEIFPDPWNATKGQAQEIVREDLYAIARSEEEEAKVQMQVVSSKRVYMPTYIVEYSTLGMEFQSFISGGDEGAGGVTGVNHKLWGDTSYMPSSLSFLDGVSSVTELSFRAFGPRGVATILTISLQFLGTIAARLFMRLPVVVVFGSIIVGIKKIIYPWMDHRYASAEWERQRETEARRDAYSSTKDNFDDTFGIARKYFMQNKTKILRKLSGENEHQQGEYDWYQKFEDWIKNQSNQEYNYQNYQQYHEEQENDQNFQQQRRRARERRQQHSKKEGKKEQSYNWDFDPNDPYSVLKVSRGASMSQISAAFRREMLKYHPDVQTGVSNIDRERSEERSKYITEAYRKIKANVKKNRTKK